MLVPCPPVTNGNEVTPLTPASSSSSPVDAANQDVYPDDEDIESPLHLSPSTLMPSWDQSALSGLVKTGAGLNTIHTDGFYCLNGREHGVAASDEDSTYPEQYSSYPSPEKQNLDTQSTVDEVRLEDDIRHSPSQPQCRRLRKRKSTKLRIEGPHGVHDNDSRFQSLPKRDKHTPRSHNTRERVCKTPTSPPHDAREETRRLQNRVAANKSRVKKQGTVQRLVDREKLLETENCELACRVQDLTREVNSLKDKVLSHADCGSSMIDAFITNEARRFVASFEEDTRD